MGVGNGDARTTHASRDCRYYRADDWRRDWLFREGCAAVKQPRIAHLVDPSVLPKIPEVAHSTKKRRDTLREELSSREYLMKIKGIAEELESSTALSRNQINSARARADIYFRLLNKTLPDLKQEVAPINLALDSAIEKQAEIVIQAIMCGRITPDEGSSVLESMGVYSKLVEFGSLLNRMDAIEGVSTKK